MNRSIRLLSLAGALAPGILTLPACVPIFTDGNFQTLKLVYKLDQSIDAGETTVVQSVVFPEKVKVKRTFVQVSGRLTAPGNDDVPGRLKIEAIVEELRGGRVVQRIALNINVDEDGFFSASKKIAKDLLASQMMTVTFEPTGAEIPRNTEVAICVDLVKKKSDLAGLPACVTGGGGGGGGGSAVTLSSLQSSIFTPTCALSGCHSSGSAQAELVLAAGASHRNLVNVSSSQVAAFDRVEPGDPEASYLVKKLRGDGDISGSRMPRGGPFLSSSELGRVIQWIENGAPDN